MNLNSTSKVLCKFSNKTCTFYIKYMKFRTEDVALLYNYKAIVKLFYKWLKQISGIKPFFKKKENAVKMQIYFAIIAFRFAGLYHYDLLLEIYSFNR